MGRLDTLRRIDIANRTSREKTAELQERVGRLAIDPGGDRRIHTPTISIALTTVEVTNGPSLRSCSGIARCASTAGRYSKLASGMLGLARSSTLAGRGDWTSRSMSSATVPDVDVHTSPDALLMEREDDHLTGVSVPADMTRS
jgi:hypothetical protein